MMQKTAKVHHKSTLHFVVNITIQITKNLQ